MRDYPGIMANNSGSASGNSTAAIGTPAFAQAVATIVGAISVAQGQGQNQPQVPQHPTPSSVPAAGASRQVGGYMYI